MNDCELMTMALKALELEDMACRYEKEQTPAHIANLITALRERLAQPEHHDPIGDAQDKLLARAYEGGVIDGMQKQMQSSVDKAVNGMTRTWQGLTDEERNSLWRDVIGWGDPSHDDEDLMNAIEDKLREKNYG